MAANRLFISVLVALACGHVGLIAAQSSILLLTPLVYRQPSGGFINGSFAVTPIIRLTLQQSIAPYPATTFTVTIKSLFLPAKYAGQFNASNIPKLRGTMTYTTTNGEVILDKFDVTQGCSQVQLEFNATALLGSETRTWNSFWSAGFNVGPGTTPAPTPTAPRSTGPVPTNPPKGPSPNDPSSWSFSITAPSAPLYDCATFNPQPSAKLKSGSGTVSADLRLINMNNNSYAAFSNGAMSRQASGAGAANFTGVAVCGLGTYALRYNVTTPSGNLVVIGDNFDVVRNPSVTTTMSPASLATAKVIFLTQPAAGIAGLRLRIQPKIRVVDKNYQLVRVTGSATLSLYFPTRLASLNPQLVGMSTVNIVDGEGEWTNVGVSSVGSGYQFLMSVTAQTTTFPQQYSSAFIVDKNSASIDRSGPEFQDENTPADAAPNDTGLAIGLSVTAGVLVVAVIAAVIAVRRRRASASALMLSRSSDQAVAPTSREPFSEVARTPTAGETGVVVSPSKMPLTAAEATTPPPCGRHDSSIMLPSNETHDVDGVQLNPIQLAFPDVSSK